MDAKAGRTQPGEAVVSRLLVTLVVVFQLILSIKMQDTRGYGVVGRRLMIQRDSRRGRPWRGQSYRLGQKIIIKLQKQVGKLPTDYT